MKTYRLLNNILGYKKELIVDEEFVSSFFILFSPDLCFNDWFEEVKEEEPKPLEVRVGEDIYKIPVSNGKDLFDCPSCQKPWKEHECPRDESIDEDCATHGNSKLANEKFWKNPYTCHWQCKCLKDSPDASKTISDTQILHTCLNDEHLEEVKKKITEEQLRKEVFGETFTVGDRTYELVPFLKEGEESISGDEMLKRAKELGAECGEEDGKYILEHCGEIPESVREYFLIFSAWRGPGDPRYVACLYWHDSEWDQYWYWLDYRWGGRYRLVRRMNQWYEPLGKPKTPFLSGNPRGKPRGIID